MQSDVLHDGGSTTMAGPIAIGPLDWPLPPLPSINLFQSELAISPTHPPPLWPMISRPVVGEIPADPSSLLTEAF